MDWSNARTLRGLAEGVRFHAAYQTRRLRQARRVRIHGVRVPLDVPMMTPEIQTSIWKGFYENNERTILQHTLEPDDVVLDVGGGIGFVAAFCASRCASVTTVEANPELIPVIERTLALNEVRATVRHGVIGQDGETASFNVSDDYLASSTASGSEQRRIEVPVIDAGELEDAVRPTYVVMDIEGGEIEALAALSLSSARKLCVEFHADVVGQASVNRTIDTLISRGFSIDPSQSRTNQKFLVRSSSGADSS